MTMKVDEQFHIMPRNAVICVFDDLAKTEAAMSALQQAGFRADQMQYLQGEDGFRIIDPAGERHGLWGALSA